MAIPDYQTLMLPVLTLASDGKEHKFSQAVEELADELDLTAKERSELLPSGSKAVFNNRVGWARSYLKQAGLLASPKRGFFTITQKGTELLEANPIKIDTSVLEQYPEFIGIWCQEPFLTFNKGGSQNMLGRAMASQLYC